MRKPVDGLCYLATPYSKYELGLEEAFRDAARLTAKMMMEGYKVYSPITHTHPIAVHGDLDPLDHTLWLPFDEAMMEVCDVLIVAKMDGWEHSYGIEYEIDFFIAAGKPVLYIDPINLELSNG